MITRMSRFTSSSLLAAALLSASAARGDYTFVNIVDGSGPFASAFGSFGSPSVNDAGTVAFYGKLDNGNVGIFKITNGVVTTIHETVASASLTVAPSINASGEVAFWKNANGVRTIYKGDGTTLTTIAVTGGSPGYTGLDDFPGINDAGVVVFDGVWNAMYLGLWKGNGGAPTALYTSQGSSFSSFSKPTINNDSVLAFSAAEFPTPGGVFKGDGATPIEITDASGPFGGFGDLPSINNSGVVVFWGSLDNGESAIGVGNGRAAATTFVSTAGPYSGLFSTAGIDINDAGTIAFYSSLDAGGHGIFTGPDPVADKVIKTGDPLFGSTVSNLQYARGLNNHGDVAFRYFLLNGQHGIAVALAPSAATPGDLDGDGDVDAADLALVLGAWGTSNAGADLNDDGIVNAADLAILLGNWG